MWTAGKLESFGSEASDQYFPDEKVRILRKAFFLIGKIVTDAVIRIWQARQLTEFDLAEYLKTPKLVGLARQDAQRTLRFIIGYRLIRDLRRGWRFNNPNLDQLGLLQIGYRGLEDWCADEALFADHPVLTALEIVDGLGQTSRLNFQNFEVNAKLASETFQFKTPAGAQVIRP